MESMMIDALRDAVSAVARPMTLGPILGAVSLTQIWRLDRRHSTGRTPRTYECALTNTVICWALMVLVYGTLGDAGWIHAIGMGAMVAPAAPLLWVLGGARLIECIGSRMCGRKAPRRGNHRWSDEKRSAVRDLYDTLSDADDETVRDQVRSMRESARGKSDERKWRGDE